MCMCGKYPLIMLNASNCFIRIFAEILHSASRVWCPGWHEKQGKHRPLLSFSVRSLCWHSGDPDTKGCGRKTSKKHACKKHSAGRIPCTMNTAALYKLTFLTCKYECRGAITVVLTFPEIQGREPWHLMRPQPELFAFHFLSGSPSSHQRSPLCFYDAVLLSVRRQPRMF